MNPYLENPLFWSEIHHLLIAAIFRRLNPQLRPKYKVAIEKRVYQTIDEDSLLVGVADVAVQSIQKMPYIRYTIEKQGNLKPEHDKSSNITYI